MKDRVYVNLINDRHVAWARTRLMAEDNYVVLKNCFNNNKHRITYWDIIEKDGEIAIMSEQGARLDMKYEELEFKNKNEVMNNEIDHTILDWMNDIIADLKEAEEELKALKNK